MSDSFSLMPFFFIFFIIFRLVKFFLKGKRTHTPTCPHAHRLTNPPTYTPAFPHIHFTFLPLSPHQHTHTHAQWTTKTLLQDNFFCNPLAIRGLVRVHEIKPERKRQPLRSETQLFFLFSASWVGRKEGRSKLGRKRYSLG